MAWHVGHSLETLLTKHNLPLPGGPFPQAFPAAVVHLGGSSVFLNFKTKQNKKQILTDGSPYTEGKIKSTLSDSVS
jgi:hypothetical protein